MRALALGLTLFLAACNAPVQDAGGRGGTVPGRLPVSGAKADCLVTDAVDGDTVRIRGRDGSGTNARLVGFDTPETFRPRCAAERRLGRQATARLRGIIRAASRLEAGHGGGRDKYDRMLIRLYADGVDVARIMITEGLARPYDGGRRRSWCKGHMT